MIASKKIVFTVEMDDDENRYICALINADINGDVNYNTPQDRDLSAGISEKNKRLWVAILENSRYVD